MALADRALAAERRALERRLREIDRLLEPHLRDDSYGAALGAALGVDPHLARLVVLTGCALVVWAHGRAALRVLGVWLVTGVVTLWALTRKLRRALRGAPAAGARPASRALARGRPASTAARRRPPPPAPVELTSLDGAVRHAFAEHDALRTLRAAQTVGAIEAALGHAPRLSPSASTARRELAAGASTAAVIKQRAAAAEEALALLGDLEADTARDGGAEGECGWSEPITMLGSTTRYRQDSAGRVTLRVDGKIEAVPVEHVLAVWREADHFDEWLPSCVGSRVLRAYGRAERIVHLSLSILGLVQRDAVLHAYAVDALDEVGKVIILARSVTPADLPGEPIPPPPAWPKVRMEYPRLTVAIEPIDEKSAYGTLLVCVDPKLRLLPDAFVQKVLKTTICVLWRLLTRAAERIGKREGAAAAAVAADHAFYAKWLTPRIREHTNALRQWTQQQQQTGADGRR